MNNLGLWYFFCHIVSTSCHIYSVNRVLHAEGHTTADEILYRLSLDNILSPRSILNSRIWLKLVRQHLQVNKKRLQTSLKLSDKLRRRFTISEMREDFSEVFGSNSIDLRYHRQWYHNSRNCTETFDRCLQSSTNGINAVHWESEEPHHRKPLRRNEMCTEFICQFRK